jgi:hypothetical protein
MEYPTTTWPVTVRNCSVYTGPSMDSIATHAVVAQIDNSYTMLSQEQSAFQKATGCADVQEELRVMSLETPLLRSLIIVSYKVQPESPRDTHQIKFSTIATLQMLQIHTSIAAQTRMYQLVVTWQTTSQKSSLPTQRSFPNSKLCKYKCKYVTEHNQILHG